MNYLEGLNEQQEIAVKHKDGPLLVLAGAGSGKTRVITCRIAHLINYHHIKPWNILAITFTNKAAKEMKERVAGLLGEQMQGIWIHTFHAACLNILRQHIDKLGFDRNFLIFDSSDQQVLVKDCMKALNIDDKSFPPKSILSEIGKAKDQLMDCDQYEAEYGSDFRQRNVAKVYKRYQQMLQNNNALDFDDIIMHTVRIFKENEDILEYYSRKFKYIMVDEYQDTNHAQFVLVSLLAKYHKNLCVVGDDDQSIYGWRGADIANILDFEKIYSDCKTIKLERNYRSTDVILEAANNVIQNNMGRKPKRLWTDITGGDKIVHMNLNDERDEAAFIVGTIKNRMDEGSSNSDFAILYRVNAQSRVLEDTLANKGIPYKIYGGTKFYDRKEIKDLMAYLRLLINVNDDVSFRRVVNEPKRGIGQTTVDKLESFAQENQMSMFIAASNATSIPGLERAATKLENFTKLISLLTSIKESMDLSELVETVIEQTGMEESYKSENTVESQARIENLREFITGVMEYETEMARLAGLEQPEETDPDEPEEVYEAGLEDYLFRVSLSTDIDQMDQDEGFVTLMTLHSAKGLEFNEVFIPGFEEEMFPSYMSIFEEDRLEEERRLCYVGFTRARKKLYLTYVNSRTIFGRTKYPMVSRFFKEIPKTCLNLPKTAPTQNRVQPSFGGGYQEKKAPAYDFGALLTRGGRPVDIHDLGKKNMNTGSKDASFEQEDRVIHAKYGEGTVSSVTGQGENAKIEIIFDKFGMKRFMLSMVQLKKV